MAAIKAAIIGCGGRGRAHAEGYAASDSVQLVGVSDSVPAAGQALAQKHRGTTAYTDHRTLLDEQRPELVSVCVWTGLHRKLVLDCVAAGVRAIHCEKPMAPTWGEAREMHQACAEARVQLTFCHQRRFGAQFVAARDLARSGAIGTVHRLEGFCSNLFDWGTHWFDMFFFYNDETPAEWVMGQIDLTGVRTVFGVPVEFNGLSYVKFANDVHAVLATGSDHGGRCANCILGSEGVIEVGPKDGPRVRMLRNSGTGWEVPNLEGVVPSGGETVLSVLDAIDCLKTGREPVLSSRKALQATELIFATYESARRRGRVCLPLEAEDSALLALLEGAAPASG